MRLIDADAYSAEMKQRQEACKEWLSGLADSELQNRAIGTLNGFSEAKLALNSMPTVDAVTVIRCKDCAFWQYAFGDWGKCHGIMAGLATYESGYCAWAERAEE